MKVIEKNCVKKQSKDVKRKSMAVMGEKYYISSVPHVIIEVVKSTGASRRVAAKN